MNTKSAFVLIITMVLMATPLTMLTPETGAENWTQTTDSDFAEGESFFIESSSGTLQLENSPIVSWAAQAEDNYDQFGISVASAGDVNGDGYTDVIVGAYHNDDGGSNAGKAYIYHGSASGLSPSPDWTDTGEAESDNFGECVASAGDVNNDGYDDVIVGAKGNDGAGSSAGEAYLYYGSSSGLSATPDWSDQGETASDGFGVSVAGAGDVNDDGYDDIIVGAGFNDGGGSNSGEAYVYYGSGSGPSSSPSWSDLGEASGDSFGTGVAGAGDVNGDGYDDIIVGAYGNDGGGSGAGEAYIYHGSSSGPSATPDWSDQGEAGNNFFGVCVAGVGDVNGDGYDDTIIGTSGAGKAYVYHGSSTGSSASPDWTGEGETPDDFYGYRVAGAGDVTGDGYDDVVISAFYNDEGANNAGKAYVYQGSSSGLSTTLLWSVQGPASGAYLGKSVAGAGDVNGDGYDDVLISAPTDGGSGDAKTFLYSFIIDPTRLPTLVSWSDQGEAVDDEFGWAVGSAGDVNGDGYDDVIVGAWANDGGGSGAGEAYVYHGSSSGLSATPDWSDQGEAAGDKYGWAVAGAGDVNNDGYDDVIVGAYANNGAGSNVGEAYIYYGSTSGLSASPDWSDQGEASDDKFGWSVSAAGDVNGDGYADIIVGAPGNDGGGSGAGEAYVYHGSSSGPSATPDWSDLGEAASDQYGYSVADAGDVNNDGYDDVVVGAITSTNGDVYVYHGSSSGLSSTPDWTDEGKGSGDNFGYDVAGAGDVNNDGYDDVIIGAPYNDNGGGNAGETYVYYGSSSGLRSSPSWTEQGEAGADSLGSAVSGAGDVNNDGFDDVIVGAYANDGAGYNAGEAYVYHGSSSGPSATPEWSDQGEAASDYFGLCLAGAGDVNGDSYGDVVVGAYGNDDGGNYAGEVYAYYLDEQNYMSLGIYVSPIFDLSASTSYPDWLSLSWSPGVQPTGTSVKAQIATSNDSIPSNWRGPDGSSSTYYSGSGRQVIFSGETGKYLQVRFFLESGLAGGDSDENTPTLTDFTLSYGTFTRPTVTLNWPNGGENLMHGETYDVIWETTGDLSSTDPVALSYRLDGGSWVSITTATENDGEYRWTLPSNEDVERALVKVVATAVDGSTVSDTCDMTFSIDPPPVNPETGDRVISPAAAEELEKGSTVVVEWQLAGEETVSLHYSTDFGQSWQPVVEDILNLGSYHWILPDDMTSEHVVLKVQGTQANVISNLFIVGEGVGAEDEKEAAEEDSQRIPAVLGSLTALLIICFVVLALIAKSEEKKS